VLLTAEAIKTVDNLILIIKSQNDGKVIGEFQENEGMDGVPLTAHG